MAMPPPPSVRPEGGGDPPSAFPRGALGEGPEGDHGEARLIERLRRGDEQAYAEIVRLHAGRLLAVARRFVDNDEDARDVVQEGILAAFRSIGAFRGESRLSTWLHRIVVNAALMRVRSTRRHEEESLDDLLPAFDGSGRHVRPCGPWRAEPEDEHARRELCAWVRKAVDLLPAGHRTVLLLRDIEEMSTQETAALLGVTENAVKIRLHRARQALRTLLEPAMTETAHDPPAARPAPGRADPPARVRAVLPG